MANYVENILRNKIDEIQKRENVYDVGRISKIQDCILQVRGLENVGYFEEVKIEGGSVAYVNGIEPNYVSVALVKKASEIHIGDQVVATGHEFGAQFSEQAVGHIVDMFGTEKLANQEFDDLSELALENPCVPIIDRSAVCRPLHTGIAGIDMVFPIGKGQRQLIIGDKKTGKTQIALDTIVNLAGDNTICIYVAIGKNKKNVKEMYHELFRRGAMKYTIILAAFNDDMTPVLTLTPYAGLAIAEYFMHKKMDVLVVLDDLKRHADAYREISLLSGKVPGREAYPADIFYTHARLLEKGCQHKDGGSITILPIVETKGGDITDYISTNIISITDGQIVLSKRNFDKGQKPAIDYGLSVSRLGGAVQTPALRKLGSSVRRELLSYLEKRDVYELANTDEMSPEIRALLAKGRVLLEGLNQYKFTPKDEETLVESFKDIVD